MAKPPLPKQLQQRLVRTYAKIDNTHYQRPRRLAFYRHIAITSIILIALGLFLRFHLIEAAEDLFESKIKQQLDSQSAALKFWLKTETNLATRIASRHRVLKLLQQIESASVTKKAELQKSLSEIVDQELSFSDSAGFLIINKDGYVVASTNRGHINQQLPRASVRLIEVVSESTFRLSEVMHSDDFLPDQNLPPILLIATRIEQMENRGYYYLVELLDASIEFNAITSLYRSDEQIEMYYFNSDGLMISESPLLAEIKQRGLLLNDQINSTILNVKLVDPVSKSQLPIFPVQHALSIGNATKFEHYRSYRDEDVLGVWIWVDELNIGLVVEVNKEEMLQLLSPLLFTELMMFALLTLSAIAMVIYQMRLRRLDDQVNAFEKLGQYKLEKKIGEGGIGSVYLAQHALLRRPTALKVLKRSLLSEEVIDRFELEVQQTALLGHPNTIQVYDYGLSPDGTFYYAMEYVRGFTLADYISEFGAMPQERVIAILLQVCGSLAEAHSRGLIHRDIKPPNIMLSEQGGIFDHVKVLDFGLVKDISDPEATQLTQTQSIAGTPSYIAPERLQDPKICDPRTDIYALGAVAYNMLSGKDLFTGTNALQIALAALKEKPVPITEVVPSPIEAKLAALVMQCVSREPAQRPRDIFEIIEILEPLQRIHPWSQQHAKNWWQKYSSPLLSKQETSKEPISEALNSL
ncbi:serine/threonine protein kinase [Corallincola luteus]|uniref:Serine/threonine protein kinase n=2 Tax=Corallincola TaxID=1775176 RepID=A0A368NIW8_9GAMM|nr:MULTISPECIES: serine/threonine protein kinase [Corallincola]RCU50537.1 serine/threonine protein kinase [Corallincola holothuriorum]TCI01861.1 serine/threonine protein kinase [Corallincola luteus]